MDGLLPLGCGRAEAKTVPARGKALINTELSIAVPEGTYGRIAPRSGLGEHHNPLAYLTSCLGFVTQSNS